MSTTTSVDNAATVASLYEAFGRGDIPFILEHVDDSCEWIGAGGDYLPAGGTYKGKLLPPDAYGFYAEVTCFGGLRFVKKGNITLIR